MPPLHEEKGEPGAAVRAASSEGSDGSSHTSAISKACEATPEEEFARLKALADSTALGLSDIWDLRGPVEWLSFLSGLVIACVVGPPVGAVLFGSMVWEWADRGGGAFIRSGRELTGFLCGRVFPSLTRATQGFNERFVKDPNDAYMINVIIGLGGLVPLMFVCCALLQRSMGTSMSELSLPLAYVYHLIRIGPFFMNFAYTYVNCHKEGHARLGLFRQPYNSIRPLRSVFNYWIGVFYGVMPGSFAWGHTINHHRYNNGPCDVVTTADKPRDSWVNFVAFLPRWFLYAVNISTVRQFMAERNPGAAFNIVLGNLHFAAWFALWSYIVGPAFATAYLIFPVLEAGLLLAAIQWTWHGFLEPVDPANEYVQSVTILDGPVNVLNEDSHVVHHQYPGRHWTEHPAMLDKHWSQYAEQRATCFRGTHAFELWGMIVARDYEALAEHFVDLRGEAEEAEVYKARNRVVGSADPNSKPNPKAELTAAAAAANGKGEKERKSGKAKVAPLTKEEKILLIKQRVRGCWWGPRVPKEIALRLQGKEIGNLEDGKGDSFSLLGHEFSKAALTERRKKEE